MDKFKKKIQEQAANKANESRSKFHGNQYTEVSSPNGDHTKIKTDKELAKMAGVSEDIYSKGKKVLNSDNETLKQEVLSGEKSIDIGYKEMTHSII